MSNLKEWMDDQWRKPGVIDGVCGVIFEGTDYKSLRMRSGAERKYKSKEQKAYEARFGLYNKKLVPIILAEATQTVRNMEVPIINKYGRPEGSEVKKLPEYRWPKERDGEAGPRVAAPVVAAIPRKRVPKAKLEQAAAIIAKVPEDELTAFLARFGLSLSLAASIASLGDVEMIARQFLRATL